MIQLAGLGVPTMNNKSYAYSRVYCGSVVAPKYLSVLLFADGRSSSRRLVFYLVVKFFHSSDGRSKGVDVPWFDTRARSLPVTLLLTLGGAPGAY